MEQTKKIKCRLKTKKKLEFGLCKCRTTVLEKGNHTHKQSRDWEAVILFLLADIVEAVYIFVLFLLHQPPPFLKTK